MTAIVDGVRVHIDFLANVMGVTHPTRLATEIVIPMETEAGGGVLAIPVMHPLHCLQSRVSNVLTLGRSDDTARRQCAAAPIVLREYIAEMLRQGEVREAMRTLTALFKYLRSDLTGRRAHEACSGNDPAEIFDYFRRDPRLDRRFRTYNLEAMRAKLSGRRHSAARRAVKNRPS